MIRKFLKDETGLELSEYAVAACSDSSGNGRSFPASGRKHHYQDQRSRQQREVVNG